MLDMPAAQGPAPALGCEPPWEVDKLARSARQLEKVESTTA